MSSEKIQDMLKALSADPKAQELLAKIGRPEDQNGEICIYADIARQLGYDITEADLKDYIEKTADLVAARTKEAEAGIKELPDEVLEKVAGGQKEHDKCKDTYRNYENCWITDGCDQIFVMYSDYVCHKTDFDDPCHETAEPCNNDEYCGRKPKYV